jgi:PilZ domain
MSDERRHHERYDNEQLVLNVARPGIKGFLRLNPTAECLDFSLAGLQFASEQVMQPGEALVLDLCVYDIELMEIYGEVVSCTQLDNGLWCCGVKFCLEDKRMKRPGIRHRLLQIEDKLRTLSQFPTATVQTAV